jgi:hypothetical protein
VQILPNVGVPQSEITATGSCFNASAPVGVTGFYKDTLGSATTDSQGSFKVSFFVPAGMSAGDYTVSFGQSAQWEPNSYAPPISVPVTFKVVEDRGGTVGRGQSTSSDQGSTSKRGDQTEVLGFLFTAFGAVGVKKAGYGSYVLDYWQCLLADSRHMLDPCGNAFGDAFSIGGDLIIRGAFENEVGAAFSAIQVLDAPVLHAIECEAALTGAGGDFRACLPPGGRPSTS